MTEPHNTVFLGEALQAWRRGAHASPPETRADRQVREGGFTADDYQALPGGNRMHSTQPPRESSSTGVSSSAVANASRGCGGFSRGASRGASCGGAKVASGAARRGIAKSAVVGGLKR